MVPFAGYSMPVQYPAGLMAEHHHTRREVHHLTRVRIESDPYAEGFYKAMGAERIGLGRRQRP